MGDSSKSRLKAFEVSDSRHFSALLDWQKFACIGGDPVLATKGLNRISIFVMSCNGLWGLKALLLICSGLWSERLYV